MEEKITAWRFLYQSLRRRCRVQRHQFSRQEQRSTLSWSEESDVQLKKHGRSESISDQWTKWEETATDRRQSVQEQFKSTNAIVEKQRALVYTLYVLFFIFLVIVNWPLVNWPTFKWSISCTKFFFHFSGIKPNENKRVVQFSEQTVRHQVIFSIWSKTQLANLY